MAPLTSTELLRFEPGKALLWALFLDARTRKRSYLFLKVSAEERRAVSAARDVKRDGHWPLLTQLSIAGVVTATVVKVPQAAVPGQRVHDACGADGMDKSCLPVCCQVGIQEEQIPQ